MLATSGLAHAEGDRNPGTQAPTALAIPVVGGTQVPPGKWPDAVAVLGAQGSCTGTLVAPDVVITAGHCGEINPAQVIVNTTNYAAQGGQTINVARTVSYPSWQTMYDVSVVVLEQAVTNVTPRNVATSCSFHTFGSGKLVHLVGFGLTSEAGTGNNTLLNEAMAPVIDADCSGGNGCNSGVAPGGEFVAGGGGTDSCFGDSGGPVYFDTGHGTVVIGAVSRGIDGSATPCGGGGIYVRTDKVIQWIESTTGKTIAKDDCSVDPATGSAAGSGGGDGSAYDSAPVEMGGCSASSDASLGVIGFVVLLIALRKRDAKPAGLRPWSA